MAEDTGLIVAELKLKMDNLEKDIMEGQKSIDKFIEELKKTEKASSEAGDSLNKNLGKHLKDVKKSVDDATKAVEKNNNTTQKAKKNADNLGKAVKDKIKNPFEEAGKQVKLFGVELGSLGKVGTALAVVVTVFKALGGVISSAIEKSREYAKELKIYNDAMKALGLSHRTGAGSANNFWKALETINNETKNTRTEFDITSERMGGALDFWKMKITGVVSSVGGLLFKVKEADVAIRNMQNANMENYNAEVTVRKAYEDEIKNIQYLQAALSGTRESAAEAEKEANAARQSANELYIRQLIQIRNNLLEANIIDYEAVDDIRHRIREQVELLGQQKVLNEKVKEQTKELATQEKIDKAREEAIAKYNQAVRRANDALSAGLIDQVEHSRQLAAAKAQEYSDLEAIVTEYKLVTRETIRLRDETAAIVGLNQDNAAAMEQAKKRLDEISAAEKERKALLLDQGDTLKEQEIERMKAMAGAAESEDEKNGYMRQAIDLENELIGLQRERERDALQQSEAFKAASDDERIIILGNFDKITAGMKKVQEEKKKTAGVSLFDTDAWQYGMEIGQAAISAFDSISSQALAISQKHAEEQIAIIDAALERTMERIEEARQMELEAEGFIEAQSEEQIQKQIDAAKQAGDEVLQYQLERRLKEKEINDRFDAQAKAAEEKAAREKAQIEYQAAKEEFALSMIQAVNAGIMAVLNGLQTKPFLPMGMIMAGVAGAAATVQISLLAANPPKPPAFADGGIIPGRKGDGDTQHVIATAGELILNEAQQENVADRLERGGEIVVNTYIVVNDEVIGKSSARYANTKGAVFEQRAIMGLR